MVTSSTIIVVAFSVIIYIQKNTQTAIAIWVFFLLLRINISVLFHRIEAGAVAVVTEVAMPHDQGTGVTLKQRFEQLPHADLLFSRARVGGLTADIESPFVADAYRMGIVVQTVGTDHPFRPTGLNLSVTTDHVVVADAEVEPPLAMPGIDLSSRAVLVGPHCRTMDDVIKSFG